MGRRLLLAWLLLGLASATRAQEPVHLVVETGAERLEVWRGERLIATFEEIAIGRFGPTPDKHRGDGATPLGRYHVVGVNGGSDFHRFIALDYPSPADARRGLAEGLITPAQFAAIETAHRQGRLPPQRTPLGGHIGIHGVGEGDLQIHRLFNWTQGCVALEDDQLDALLTWVRPGLSVEIR